MNSALRDLARRVPFHERALFNVYEAALDQFKAEEFAPVRERLALGAVRASCSYASAHRTSPWRAWEAIRHTIAEDAE